MTARDEGAVEDLYAWLAQQDRLRGRVRFADGQVQRGHMGSALTDVLTVAVGGGGALAILAQALTVWLKQPRRSLVSVKVWSRRGSHVEISANRADDIPAILREALGTCESDDGASR